jgi:hypothetical protein
MAHSAIRTTLARQHHGDVEGTTDMSRRAATAESDPLDDMRQQFGHLTECPNVAQSGRIEVIARMSALRGEADLA